MSPNTSRKTITAMGPTVLVFFLAVVGHTEAPFDYFTNSWSTIGLKDYEFGTRITPDNKLLVAKRGAKSGNRYERTAVQIRFGRELEPLSRAQTKRPIEGWLPVVLITAEDGAVRYDFKLWSTPLPTVKDWKAAYNWPTEGENFLNWIQVHVMNTGDSQYAAKLSFEWEGQPEETKRFSWELAPGDGETCVARVPWEPADDGADFSDEDPDLWFERTISFWKNLIGRQTDIEVPCEKATQAYKAAHVCQLIASDHGELHGGEGFYDEFYIRDGGYQVMELEEAGQMEAARKAMEAYLSHQRPDGRFESQKNQFDANGQALWVLWQFSKITGDKDWLQEAYPQMRKAADWIGKARREAPADSPFPGVLPNAPADGEFLWDGNHHILGYDFWNLRGLLCTADAAQTLGKTDEAEELRRQATDYRQAIDDAWKKTGVPHFPPSWEKEGTHWGNTETLWPTPIFEAEDRRVTALLEEVRERHGGGFVEGAIRWVGGEELKNPSPENKAIHPYMSAYTTMASLVRGEDEKVVEEFYWYLLHSTATNGFPEGIYYKRRFAWSDTIPHVTGASNYALLLRHMLIHEQGDELHLLKAVPDWWLSEGEEIRVERGPTHFGEMNLVVRGKKEGVQVEFDRPSRQQPSMILVHLPNSRPLLDPIEGVQVILRADQDMRWDFPTVVSLYGEMNPGAFEE